MFSVRFVGVQSYLANRFVNAYVSDCASSFQIKYLDTDFFQSIRLKNLEVKDSRNEAFITVEELRVNFKSLVDLRKNLEFDGLNLLNPEFNIRVYKGDSSSNFKQWLNCFPESESKKDIRLLFTNSEVLNGSFSYVNENRLEKTSVGKINYNDLSLSNLNFNSDQFELLNDSVFASVNMLSFTEKSGFFVSNFNSKAIYINQNSISTEDLQLSALSSDLNFNELSFNFNNYSNFSHFIDSVNIQSKIDESNLQLNDLAYFYQPFDSIIEQFSVSGNIDGTVSNLQLSEAIINKVSEHPLIFNGDAHMNGLPDINNTFFTVTSDKLIVDKYAIENLELLKLAKLNIHLPNNISRLGRVEAKGDFKGYLQGFMSKFDISTDLGNLRTDLNFYYDGFEDQIVYDGNISTKSFNVGKLYGVKEIGRIAANANINAKGLTIDALRTEIKSSISSFEINNYSYNGINIEGVLQKNLFDGIATINDENIKASYKGDINFKDAVPHFDFDVMLSHARLDKLNLYKEQSDLSLKLLVHGKATSIDDFSGIFKMDSIYYSQNELDYHLDSVVLISSREDQQKHISFNSDIADADLSGNFYLSHIPDIFYSLMAEVMPKKIRPKDSYNISDHENLKFRFNLKDLSAVSTLISEDLYVSKNASFSGEYDSDSDFFDFYSNIDFVEYAGLKLYGISLDTYLSELYEVELYIDSVSHMEVLVPNVSIFSAVYEDNFGLQAHWKGNKLKGFINGSGYWDEIGLFHFDLTKSDIETPQQKWNLVTDANLKEIDSMSFKLSGLMLQNGDQNININGLISHKPTDDLSIEINNVSLNDVVPVKSIKLDGNLNADIKISSILNQPRFRGNLNTDLIINDFELGKLELKTGRLNVRNNINILGVFQQSGKDVIGIRGRYNTEQQALKLNYIFNKLQVSPIEPFLPETLSDLEAEISGNLSMSGTITKPEINGNLELDNGRLKINELNTEYTFNGDLKVEPDLIYATSAYAFDENSTQATVLSASFYHDNFTDYSYEFSVHMNEPFLALNTTYDDNSLFYGTAYATGFVNVSYDKYNLLEIDVDAQSEKNTNITLPLYGAEEVSIGNFVSFVDFSDTSKIINEEISLSGITMNFNFLATPEAQLNLVFDDVVGDKITTYGTGNIFMEVDQYDHFKMYGQYELDGGEYLFTLKNVINKKFELAKGGTLNWYGDPYNAEIDVDAVYNVKASVSDLVPEENARHEVDCYLSLSNNLFSPAIGFEIQVPDAPEKVQSALRSAISTQEELNRQFFSLLLINKFLPRQNSAIGGSIESGVSTSTSEVLTNQLSQILDQWWEGVDIGVNYESGDELTNDEYAVALSTQLFNEKLSLSGNFGVSQNQNVSEDNNNLIGDVMIEYTLDEKGTFKLKAFNQSNSYDPTRSFQGDYTQGVGLSYQKSFDEWNELEFWLKFKQWIKK